MGADVANRVGELALGFTGEEKFNCFNVSVHGLGQTHVLGAYASYVKDYPKRNNNETVAVHVRTRVSMSIAARNYCIFFALRICAKTLFSFSL